MAQHVARSDLKLGGRLYKRGEVVDLGKVKPDLRKKLIDQRRVIPDEVRVSTGRSRKES